MRALVAAALVAAIPASAEGPAITVSIGCDGGMPMLIQIEAKRAASVALGYRITSRKRSTSARSSTRTRC